MKEKEEIHHVFWTGGQDSTFRLLQLLSTTNELIQPHYVVRHEESTGNEIDTMTIIRRAAIKKFPEWRSRFLPTVYINGDLIPRYPEIDEKIEEMRKTMRVHEQYQVLTSYCKYAGIGKIDVSYETDFISNKPKNPIRSYFDSGKFPFESFRNPITEMTKRSCYEFAKDHGWDDLLNMIWFCRRPLKKVVPCGICGPCTDTVDNGMGFRLPLKSRLKARILIPFRKFYRKNYLKHETSWFFRLVKRKLEPRM
jgi:hypothetical protein